MKNGTLIKMLAISLLLALALLALNGVLAATEEQELRSELLSLTRMKDELLSAGIGTTRINDLITEGDIYFNSQNYNKTREIISAAHELRDNAFNTKNQLNIVNTLYMDISKNNISLFKTEPSSIEWELNYSQREFEKENFEEALKTSGEIKKTLLNSISNKYAYLNDSILTLEEKTGVLELSTYRIMTLKGMLAEALATGKISELEMIEKEVEDLSQSLTYYEEIKLAIPTLDSKNLSTQRIRDGLSETQASMNIADYKSAINQLESLTKIIDHALKLKEEQTVFEKTLSEEKAKIQIDWTATEKLLEKSKYELAVGNYEEAELQLTLAKKTFESTKAQFLIESVAKKAPGFNLKEFVTKNWLYIFAVIILIILVLKLTQKAWSYEIRRRHLSRMEKELKVIEKMVRELQKDYFARRKMSRESYDEAYETLEDKIILLKERISMLNKKIKKQENKP